MIKTRSRKVYWKLKPSFYKIIMDMKKNKIGVFAFVVIFVLNSFVPAARAQPQHTPSQSRGLITRLLEIKYTTELYASTRGKNDSKNVSNNDTVMAVYNTLRWKIDGLVYQLSGDMIAANSPRKFIRLDKWCLKVSNRNNEHDPANQYQLSNNVSYPTHLKIYILALQEIESFYETNVIASLKSTTRLKTLNLTTNVFYLLKDSYAIIKGLSDMKTQKTMALVELLDHTRLLSPEELGKRK
jgi:hypothetical protein